MKIAINTRQLSDDFREGYGYFVLETMKRITECHPEHEFIFLSDRPFNNEYQFGNNVKKVIAGPSANHPLLWKWWYHIKVPAILRRHKVDVFVSCDGICSLATKVPQCLVVPDLPFLYSQSHFKKSHLLFYKRNRQKFLNKANSIAVISEFIKSDLLKHYQIKNKDVSVLSSAVNHIFQPAGDVIKKEVKEKYTGGKEYFVYAGDIHHKKNILNLLKAFSLFKKKQKTGMKLVFAGKFTAGSKSLSESLRNYKFRDDVIITGHVEEDALAAIISAAYAMVHPVIGEGFAFSVLAAIKCGVPVITSAGSSMQEIAGDAALFTDFTNSNAIAEKMMLLYKDENLRNKLMLNTKEPAGNYTWDKTATLLWKSILKAVE